MRKTYDEDSVAWWALNNTRKEYLLEDGSVRTRTPPHLFEVPDLTTGTTSGFEQSVACYRTDYSFGRSVSGEATARINDRGPLKARPIGVIIKNDHHTALLFQKLTSADTIDSIIIHTMTNLKTGIQEESSITLTNCQITKIVSDGYFAYVEIYYDQIDFSYNQFDRSGTNQGAVAAGFNYSTWSASGS